MMSVPLLQQAQALSRHCHACDKLARNFLAGIQLASAIILLKLTRP
jgi:hypothetical protein